MDATASSMQKNRSSTRSICPDSMPLTRTATSSSVRSANSLLALGVPTARATRRVTSIPRAQAGAFGLRVRSSCAYAPRYDSPVRLRLTTTGALDAVALRQLTRAGLVRARTSRSPRHGAAPKYTRAEDALPRSLTRSQRAVGQDV